MAIFRGDGGAGDANTTVTINEVERLRSEAQIAATNAASSASNALTSEQNAALSESNVANVASNALASEQAAALSENNALASEQAAAISESNAGTSEANALASEQAASLSESNAGISEANSLASEQAAFSSEQAASLSESNAASSEMAASLSESNALASEIAAGISETNAATSESNALNSENKAQQWATEDEDVPVETSPDLFSAKHWAAKAATFDPTLYLSKDNPSYTGTLTGGTGVVNLGSGQFYKDASGNVGIGTSAPGQLLDVNGTANATNLTRNGSQVYSRDNILGTVSQSGGVPTGAIIERGSNANGEFVRYADGTQITSSAAFTTGQTHGFPASFVAAPVIGLGLAAIIARSASHGTPTVASVTVYIWDTNGNQATGTIRVYAIGRWF